MTLEVNHYLKNAGSFWMMIKRPTEIMVKLGNQPKNGGWTSRHDKLYHLEAAIFAFQLPWEGIHQPLMKKLHRSQ